MATYAYRCAAHGPVDVARPIGTAQATIACPRCGAPSPRLITAPMLGLADRRRTALADRAEASRTEPPVVSALPPARRNAPAHRPDPRTASLPRP